MCIIRTVKSKRINKRKYRGEKGRSRKRRKSNTLIIIIIVMVILVIVVTNRGVFSVPRINDLFFINRWWFWFHSADRTQNSLLFNVLRFDNHKILLQTLYKEVMDRQISGPLPENSTLIMVSKDTFFHRRPIPTFHESIRLCHWNDVCIEDVSYLRVRKSQETLQQGGRTSKSSKSRIKNKSVLIETGKSI